jgi:transcriptional regulator with XRE-family HTH domain
MTARQPRDVVMRCGVCGFQSGPTTPGLAAKGMRKHSCELWLARAARAERVAARKARSGPVRECQHKRANHQHGTRQAYVCDRCRCRPCTDANTADKARVNRLKLYGQWDGRVDAAPVREHVLALAAAGMGHKRIARLAGVSGSAVSWLLYGKTREDGTRRPPSRKVNAATAEKLLAVQPDVEVMAPKAVVDATGARRRLRALVAHGWTARALAKRMGMTDSNFARVLHAETGMHAETVLRVRALYDELWNVRPPERNGAERQAASRARNLAERNGWLPALAWDDDTIDDPAAWANETNETDETDTVDEVAVELFVEGALDWRRVSPTERLEAAVRLDRMGVSRNVIAERTHLNSQTLQRALVEANGRRIA